MLMRNISDTIAHFSALRKSAMNGGVHGESRLTELSEFGTNPGSLRAHVYIPASLSKRAALVVVLHGCTQTASGYDIGSGWSDMAERHGFALLFPEQQAQNNPNLCFNWFTKAGSGREAASIRQMIEAISAEQDIDPSRVFVTGLSAGGAMTAVMLATYPEVFAGGAVIAGLPYGSAEGVPQALERMRGHNIAERGKLERFVRRASAHRGPWPKLSVWHGSSDATVAAANADALVEQWTALHGLQSLPARRETVDGHIRRAWLDRKGQEVVEDYRIPGMGHGTPLKTTGDDGCGRSGAFMLEVGISSTYRICRFWKLIEREARTDPLANARDKEKIGELVGSDVPLANEGRHLQPLPHQEPSPTPRNPVRKVIEDALRSAGLMP